LIPSGPIPPNPGELLASSRLTALLDEMKETYDFILMDSPPALPVADASVMAPRADGVLVVVNGQATKAGALQGAISIIQQAKTPVLGVVINKFRRPRFGYGYYYKPYYYYYSAYGGYGGEEDTSVNGSRKLGSRIGNRVKSSLSKLRGR
jgi:capsular exopolysaccharide synthesis family protein